MSMPSEAVQGAVDVMSETMTPQEAARVVASASRFEEGLQQRTEGLTQMTWGVVTAANFVTYGFADVLGAPAWAFSVLWVPWIAAGTLMTAALWRSAALSGPAGRVFERPRGLLLRVLGLSALFTGLFALFQPEGPTMALAIIGGVWALMAAVNLYAASPLGRALWGGAGMTLLATAALLAALGAPVEVAGTVSIVACGLVPMATGLYQTFRG